MLNEKRKLLMPTEAQDAVINAGIVADLNTYELNKAEFKQLKRVGYPKSTSSKVAPMVRHDAEVESSPKFAVISFPFSWLTRCRPSGCSNTA